jgi:tetratricopeptide (TPR) repeat protein
MRVTKPTVLLVMLVLPSTRVGAQAAAQQSGAAAATAGTIALANVDARARAAILGAFAENANWHFMAAYEHANDALSIDSTLGLARIIREYHRGNGNPVALPEYQRGVRDMSARPIPEITFGLGIAAAGVNATRLLAAAVAMYPNDRYVALQYALSLTGKPRVDSLRSLAVRYPDFAGPRVWFPYFAMFNYWVSYPPSMVDEATRMATDAMRIAPAEAAPHAALAHVLIHSGRRGQALPHVRQALKLDPRSEYAYFLAAELYFFDGQPNAVERTRAALDSAAMTSPNLTRQLADRRSRATLLLQEGRVDEMEAELLAIAHETERVAPGATATTYLNLAVLFAGTRDTAKVLHYVAEAHRASPTVGREVEVDALGIARLPVQARAALDVYLKSVPNPMPAAAATVAKRLAATVAYAEGKYEQALSDCTDTNPYCEVVKVESLIALGRTREADAMRTAFLARTDASDESRALAIMRYRATPPR